MNKMLDIVKVKKAVKDKEVKSYVKKGIIYLTYCGPSEETVMIGEIPSKGVVYSGDGYADGHMVYDMAECPECGRDFEDGWDSWECSFCPDCGQPLNWRE